tara:strand:- start:3841 stop:3990 length:150 start_codon:yes stop_codon:yes gene_type:complete
MNLAYFCCVLILLFAFGALANAIEKELQLSIATQTTVEPNNLLQRSEEE